MINGKTKIYFGPPLAALTEGENNTLEISGKINRTAERYLAILSHHSLTLTDPEKACIKAISMIGHMMPDEIEHLHDDVDMFDEDITGLDKPVLVAKLKGASYADLIAMVELLGC